MIYAQDIIDRLRTEAEAKDARIAELERSGAEALRRYDYHMKEATEQCMKSQAERDTARTEIEALRKQNRELEAQLRTAEAALVFDNKELDAAFARAERAEAQLAEAKAQINESEEARNDAETRLLANLTQLDIAREALLIARQWMPVAPFEGPAVADCFKVDAALAQISPAAAPVGRVVCWKHGGTDTCATCDCANRGVPVERKG